MQLYSSGHVLYVTGYLCKLCAFINRYSTGSVGILKCIIFAKCICVCVGGGGGRWVHACVRSCACICTYMAMSLHT